MPHLSHFVFFFLGGGESLLFNMAPKCVAEVLPRVPQCNKVVIHLMEKIRVLD